MSEGTGWAKPATGELRGVTAQIPVVYLLEVSGIANRLDEEVLLDASAL